MVPLGDSHQARFLIRDGAGQFTRSFDTVLAASGITAIRIPPRSPQANAFAERWVRTLRHELLDRTIIWNEHQLRRLLEEYIDHYNNHRHHLQRTHQPIPHRSLNHIPANSNNQATASTRARPIFHGTSNSTRRYEMATD
jgi:putative transposase